MTTGTLDFTPSFDVGADIEPNLSDPLSSVKEFHVIATGALAADLELDAGLAKLTGTLNGTDLAELIAQGITGSPSTTIASYPIDLGTISIGDHQHPGPRRLHRHARLRPLVRRRARRGRRGEAATAVRDRGPFEYQNSAMTPVFSHTERLHDDRPELDDGLGHPRALQREARVRPLLLRHRLRIHLGRPARVARRRGGVQLRAAHRDRQRGRAGGHRRRRVGERRHSRALHVVEDLHARSTSSPPPRRSAAPSRSPAARPPRASPARPPRTPRRRRLPRHASVVAAAAAAATPARSRPAAATTPVEAAPGTTAEARPPTAAQAPTAGHRPATAGSSATTAPA